MNNTNPCTGCISMYCGDCPFDGMRQDYQDIKMLEKCMKCELPWDKCPATHDCPNMPDDE